MKLKNIIRIVLILSIILSVHSSVNASYSIENLPDTTVYGDFVVGPGKYQVEMKPGETKVVNIIITNRTGVNKDFQIQIEDFTGSRDTARSVVLLDGERGPYSLKDYLKVEAPVFTIGNAQRVTVPVTVSLPTDAQPGGLYGSIVVGTVTSRDDKDRKDIAGVNPIITRIGSLFFIKVKGDVKQDLVLKDFSLKDHRTILSSGPVDFEVLYENNGTIHENPSGTIKITKLFGAEIAKIDLEPWFVLPDSLRVREISWKSPFLFGRYIATAEIKKGYDEKIDTASVTFWVIPWKIVTGIFIAIVLFVLITKWLLSKIKISIR